MRILPVFAAALMIGTGAPTAGIAQAQDATPGREIMAAVGAPTRLPENMARDQYRHPAETLAFFGVKPTDTVVEIWPGGGWYTEILAPYLAGKGTLYIAAASEKGQAAVKAKQAASPELYRTVKYAIFPEGAGPKVPAGTADAVLTFRNVHNWRFGESDKTQAAFDQMFAMLKPGGTLGVEEHRLPEGQAGVEEGKSGYMKQSTVVAYATRAGFKLVAESGVNANPKDTHDYPKGVWTLPPTYQEGDTDRARYAAIGESDRMTLKFVKPK
ncbi:class I SAM-dependent methyltransferase [Sphingomonas alpina]|uniref:Class I SAM-dependent methyltransferase n=1 Tax=Sphingomonas alpina TaxID=653931 RepID=A0A7H0LKG8_9SPHN|nr:class I SAM-dependent methyltransferase [Sphingomonas alpina]QNQ10171.1 class I SAM-dependent methyltransferase [Sphingomonas alpina]